eukprot:6557095-Alexandrium_andersonii.AAC.1
MTNAYSSTACCHRCRARKDPGELCYSNFHTTASWRTQLMSHEEFVASQRIPSVLQNAVGWHRDMIKADMMHTIFQGTGQRFCASAVVVLVQSGRWGPTQMGYRRLFKAAWLECKGWLQTLRISCDMP